MLVEKWLFLLIFFKTWYGEAASSTPSDAVGSVFVSGGLVNLGNTCYLNSQLECAYHIPYLRNMIVHPASVSVSGSEDCTSFDDPSAGLISLQHQFNVMEIASKRGNGNHVATPSVSTAAFCRNLGISVYEQQDAQEFWKLLLPEIDFPPLTDLYRGKYESYIAALDGSGREKIRIEMFLDLSLDVTNFGDVDSSLDDLLTSGEILSVKEGNGWRPEKGAEKVDALKGNTISSDGLPKILQLHLMRFTYDWRTQMMSKINDRFAFSKKLDLSKICKDTTDGDVGTVYDLQSIVIHAGAYGSGHYYSYVRPDIRKNKWLRYDDDRVTEVSFKDVKRDAFGGHAVHKKKKLPNVASWRRILSSISPKPNQFGWGGKSSSAYMLQYVKRRDIPLLYDI